MKCAYLGERTLDAEHIGLGFETYKRESIWDMRWNYINHLTRMKIYPHFLPLTRLAKNTATDGTE